MVFKKYKIIKGKRYGPYYYESVRQGDHVTTRYLGMQNPEPVGETVDKTSFLSRHSSAFSCLSIGFVFVFLLSIFVFSPTGQVSLDISTTYQEGEIIRGNLNLHLAAGELLPIDSHVIVSLGNQSKDFILRDLVDSPLSRGTFYASHSVLSGVGEGYGVTGSKITTPDVSFELEIAEGNSGNAGESSERSTALENEEKKETPKEEKQEDKQEKKEEKKEDKQEKKEAKEEKKEEKKEDKQEKKEEHKSSLTGSVIAASVETIFGKASKGNDFKTTLRAGQRVEIVKGSVKVNGKAITDDVVTVVINNRDVIVSTSYSDEEKGYGKDFKGSETLTLSINVSALGVRAEQGILNISLVYGTTLLISVAKEIIVEQNVREEQNVSLPPNQTSNVTVRNVTLPSSNTTLVDDEIFAGNVSVKTSRATQRIRLGEKVKWVKNVTLERAENTTIELPKEADNVSVRTIDNRGEREAVAVVSGITGNVVSGKVSASLELEQEQGGFLSWLKGIWGRITGRAVTDVNTTAIEGFTNTVEVKLSDNATQYTIEYETDAPIAIEVNTSNGKQVVISGPDELNYTDVVSFTTLEEKYAVGQESRIRIRWEEGQQVMAFTANDTNGNGLIDYVEWVTPHLSNQTFSIILITKAEHLDENMTFISDIYDFVKARDGNFTTISAGQYVRVTFERNLTNVNDITIYARSNLSGSVQVYEHGSNTSIADFGTISEDKKYRILLTSLTSESQDVFDLKVSGNDVEFDYIVDPAGSINVTFVAPTESDGTNLSRTNIMINVSISNSSALSRVEVDLYNSSRALINYTNTTIGSSLFANFTGLSDGIYYFNATGNDSSDNRTYTNTSTVVIDTTLPLISYGTGTENNRTNVSLNWIYVNVSVNETNERNITFRLYNDSGEINTSMYADGRRTINWTELADGNYTYNVTLIDAAGNSNATAQRVITLDRTAPIFVNKTKQSGFVSRLINLTVSVNDTGVGVQGAKATIYYPNGSVANYTMSTSSGLGARQAGFNLTLNLTSAGDYDVNYTINDSLSHNLTVGDFFESIAIPLNLTGNITTADGALKNYTLTFNRPGTNVTLYNFSDAQYSLSANQLNQRVYDLKVHTGSDVYTFASVNLTTTYVPVNIDNYSTSLVNLTLYKILKGVAVNTTYAGNATLNLSYSGQFDASTSAVTESGLTIHKCSDWNYSGRACTGSFTLYSSNHTLYAAEDRAIINTSSFSSFLVTEYTCGNNICQTAFGETTSTCSLDCSSGTTSTSSSGGGGGGASSVVFIPGISGVGAVQYVVLRINTDVTLGETATDHLVLSNTGLENITLRFSLDSSLKDVFKIDYDNIRVMSLLDPSSNTILNQYKDGEEIENESISEEPPPEMESENDSLENLSFSSPLSFTGLVTSDLDEREVVVPAAHLVNIPLVVQGTREGIYSGNLHILQGNSTRLVPVRILIKSKAGKLLNVEVVLDAKSVTPGADLSFKVNAFNLGQERRYQVKFLYALFDRIANKSITSLEESVPIETSLSLARKLPIPRDLPHGTYNLVVIAQYDVYEAIASVSFEVGGTSSQALGFLKEYAPLFFLVILILFFGFYTSYYFVSIRKKLLIKKLEEKQAESIYPFPDFTKLPQSKYAYVGLIADTDQKAYFDTNQLTKHILIAGGTGAGKTVSGMIIVEELLKRGLSVVVLDPIGQWTGFVKKNEDKGMKEVYAKFGLNGGQAFATRIIDIDESTMGIDLVHYVTKPGLTVLRMDELTPSKVDIFIESALEQIYRAKLSETNELRSLVVLDEVHRLLPKYGGHKAYTKLEQAVREFRKWGVGLLMISQVLTDFKGAIRGNIGTEIQMRSRYEGDIKRVRERHGMDISKLISRLPTAIGLIETPFYNKGNPYFIEFRPLLHSPFKLSEKEVSQLVNKEKVVLCSDYLPESKRNVSEPLEKKRPDHSKFLTHLKKKRKN
ncbi:MAG: helicase HerA-like domain-containing protein [Nanoarchaeota archaeon]